MLLTNAAGGICEDMVPPELVAVEDHLSFSRSRHCADLTLTDSASDFRIRALFMTESIWILWIELLRNAALISSGCICIQQRAAV